MWSNFSIRQIKEEGQTSDLQAPPLTQEIGHTQLRVVLSILPRLIGGDKNHPSSEQPLLAGALTRAIPNVNGVDSNHAVSRVTEREHDELECILTGKYSVVSETKKRPTKYVDRPVTEGEVAGRTV